MGGKASNCVPDLWIAIAIAIGIGVEKTSMSSSIAIAIPIAIAIRPSRLHGRRKRDQMIQPPRFSITISASAVVCSGRRLRAGM